jgi:hypothetical protein
LINFSLLGVQCSLDKLLSPKATCGHPYMSRRRPRRHRQCFSTMRSTSSGKGTSESILEYLFGVWWFGLVLILIICLLNL